MHINTEISQRLAADVIGAARRATATEADDLMNVRQYSINEALIDPKGAFGSPENVICDPRLDRRAKLEILRKWRHEAQALAAAEYEGMEGGEPAMLHRVERAIDHLKRNDGD
jgi:hypothetical protein